MGLYRHIPSEHALISTATWRPSEPVIGREFHVARPVEDLNERSRSHRYALAYLTAFLVLASVFVAYSVPPVSQSARVSYNLHSPIAVDGDADLFAQAVSESWSGTGVAGDPIVIRDYEIDASISGIGISVMNTRLFFSIDSCYIYSGTMYGVYLQNVSNATILKCIVVGCGEDLSLRSVFDTIVADTECSNANNGIYLSMTTRLAFSNVTSDTNAEGIYAYRANDTRLVNSSFSGNIDAGAWLESCNITRIDLCQFDYNDYGVYATDCYWMMLTNSTCIAEGTEGVYVGSSHYFMLANSTITGTFGEGIYVEGSYKFMVADNNLTGNNYGAYFYNSQDFGFHDNNISSDLYAGAYVDICDDFGVRNNSCYYGDIGINLYLSNGSVQANTLVNVNYGIYAVQSNGVDIGENNCSYDSYGIYVQASSNVQVWNNTCSWCGSAGIYADTVTNSRISNNNCSNGTSVLLLVYSDFNEISDNVCSGNSMMGIDLEVSSWNTVRNNRCNWSYDGIYLAASLHNSMFNNWCANNSNYGIEVTTFSDGNTLNMNMICDNAIKGIQVGLSRDTVITNNFCRSNEQGGIAIEASLNATLASNMLVHNGVWLSGNLPEYWYSHSIDQTNWVNGRPVVYVANQTAVLVTENAGQVLVANSMTVLVNGKVLSDATVGLEAGFSNTILLNNSNCGMNYYGAYFYLCSDFAASNCSFGSSVTGLRAELGTYMMVDNCTFWDGSTGVLLSQVSNGYVKDNDIRSEYYGVFLSADNGIQVWDNNCSYNTRGITLGSSTYIDINNNTCDHNLESGIFLDQSDYNIVDNNALVENLFAIYLSYTGHCDLRGNQMVGDGIYLQGYDLEDWNTHSISTTNTVNGRPVYYYKNATLQTVPGDGGQVILAKCNSMMVTGGNLSHASVGLSLGFCNNTQVSGLNCSGGYTGMFLYHSNRNNISLCGISDNLGGCGISSVYDTGDTIRNNTINRNRIGVIALQTTQMRLVGNIFGDNEEQGAYLGPMTTQCQIWNNTFAYNNGALDNSTGSFLQAYDGGSSNTWHDPLNGRGNYWNDWVSPDSNGDGIVDNPYVIQGPAGSRDMYPLVNPTNPYVPIPEFGLLLTIPLVMLVAALVRRRSK